MNYVSISRTHSHIKENLTVNPSLYIPESLRVPLAEGESERSRKNVKLETVHGHIDAEILLVQSKVALETRSPQRATLQATSTHGGIKVTIVSLFISFLIASINRFLSPIILTDHRSYCMQSLGTEACVSPFPVLLLVQ